MKEELNLTKTELVELIAKERRLNCMEEYYTMRRELLDKVVRVLDLSEAYHTTISNNKRTKKIINKYAKTYKKEKDIKKVIENMEIQEETISYNYLVAFVGLVDTVHKILYAETFRKDLPEMELWYEFEMEDMVFVNGLIRELKCFNSSNVTVEDIFEALNKAIYEYIHCFENGIEYKKMFKNFLFIEPNKSEQVEDDE